ncbi:MAG TPA: hypothetical protein VMF61_03870 [Candidatus Acidoferrales bacterium]|nr:hypothetical protein [Candidatus Acidoferrales bacterium]
MRDLGIALFAVALAALGVETMACAHLATHVLGPRFVVVPVLPFLPPNPWICYPFGVFLAVCAAALLRPYTRSIAAPAVAALFLACALLVDVPKHNGRTVIFEPLAIAALALLIPGGDLPKWLRASARLLLAACLIVFGVDHFLALDLVASLIPAWIPWHLGWAAFFGAAFIAAGLALLTRYLEREAAGGVALMYAVWVVTLHLPRTLGLYGIPGAIRDPAEWSSLFIAIALCGGALAFAYGDG